MDLYFLIQAFCLLVPVYATSPTTQRSTSLAPPESLLSSIKGYLYTITVVTSDMRDAGTDANVFICLYDSKKKQACSGFWLKNGKFERGKTDIFNVNIAQLLSPLSKLEIGHDNSGKGPGWFLDRVVVDCPSTGIKQVFVCNRWLALDEDDGLIQRTLYEQKSLRKTAEQTPTTQRSTSPAPRESILSSNKAPTTQRSTSPAPTESFWSRNKVTIILGIIVVMLLIVFIPVVSVLYRNQQKNAKRILNVECSAAIKVSHLHDSPVSQPIARHPQHRSEEIALNITRNQQKNAEGNQNVECSEAIEESYLYESIDTYDTCLPSTTRSPRTSLNISRNEQKNAKRTVNDECSTAINEFPLYENAS